MKEIPYSLDWGSLTLEGYDKNKNEVIHIFNIDISIEENINRCIIFCAGRLLWSKHHIPDNARQKVVFDLRGQPIALLDRARRMKKEILEIVNEVDNSSSILIEILI